MASQLANSMIAAALAHRKSLVEVEAPTMAHVSELSRYSHYRITGQDVRSLYGDKGIEFPGAMRGLGGDYFEIDCDPHLSSVPGLHMHVEYLTEPDLDVPRARSIDFVARKQPQQNCMFARIVF